MTMAHAGRQRIFEVVAHPQLITGHPTDQVEIWRDALVELKTLLDSAVLGTTEATAKQDRVQDRGLLELKEAGVQILKLGACARRPTQDEDQDGGQQELRRA